MKQPAFDFDETEHIYRLKTGVEVPGCTRVIDTGGRPKRRECGFVRSYYMHMVNVTKYQTEASDERASVRQA